MSSWFKKQQVASKLVSNERLAGDDGGEVKDQGAIEPCKECVFNSETGRQ